MASRRPPSYGRNRKGKEKVEEEEDGASDAVDQGIVKGGRGGKRDANAGGKNSKGKGRGRGGEGEKEVDNRRVMYSRAEEEVEVEEEEAEEEDEDESVGSNSGVRRKRNNEEDRGNEEQEETKKNPAQNKRMKSNQVGTPNANGLIRIGMNGSEDHQWTSSGRSHGSTSHGNKCRLDEAEEPLTQAEEKALAMTLRRLMAKFSMSQLLDVAVREWGLVPDAQQLERSKTRQQLIDRLIALLFARPGVGDNAATDRHHQLADVLANRYAILDILNCQLRPAQKKWQVYRLTPDSSSGTTESQPPVAEITDAATLHRRLVQELSVYFKHHLCIRRNAHTVWIRLSIDEGIEATTVRAKGDAAMSGVPTKHLVSYVVYNLQSNAIFLTNLRSEQREYLIHALEVVLRCKLQYAQLAGRNLDALSDLVLNQASQGPFSAYRKHNKSEDASREERLNPRNVEEQRLGASGLLVAEDSHLHEATARHIEETFGSDEQPALDRVEFRVVDTFRADGIQLNGTFPCTVRFEGPNVLEGLRSLMEFGIATAPLPPYLANLHSMAQNRLSVDNSNERTSPMPEPWKRGIAAAAGGSSVEDSPSTSSSGSPSTSTGGKTSSSRRVRQLNLNREMPNLGIVRGGAKPDGGARK